jgi:hypothetical protein
MGVAGRVIAIASALLVPVSLLLPFLTVGPLSPKSYSGWQLYNSADILATVNAAAVIFVASSSFFMNGSPVFGAIVVGLGAFILGQMLPEEINVASEIGIGDFLINVAAVGIIIGGAMMLLYSVAHWRRARRAMQASSAADRTR